MRKLFSLAAAALCLGITLLSNAGAAPESTGRKLYCGTCGALSR